MFHARLVHRNSQGTELKGYHISTETRQDCSGRDGYVWLKDMMEPENVFSVGDTVAFETIDLNEYPKLKPFYEKHVRQYDSEYELHLAQDENGYWHRALRYDSMFGFVDILWSQYGWEDKTHAINNAKKHGIIVDQRYVIDNE